MNTFASRLREERERIGLTQSQLGSFGNVKKLAQVNYENGKRVPDALYLAGVRAAGVDVQYLLTGTRLPQSAGSLSGFLLDAAGRSGNLDVATSAARAMTIEARAREDMLAYPLVNQLLGLLYFCSDETISELAQIASERRLDNPLLFSDRMPPRVAPNDAASSSPSPPSMEVAAGEVDTSGIASAQASAKKRSSSRRKADATAPMPDVGGAVGSQGNAKAQVQKRRS